MTILFLHGWQSTPGGIKPTYLKDGYEVLNPALPDEDFDEAVRIAQAEFDRHHPDVVVGSSRGGAVAMNIDTGSTPLVLLCPAWKHFGTATSVKPGTIILHSQADNVVPFADSVELVENSSLSSDSLIDVGTEHRLADEESLEAMLKAVEKAYKPRVGWRPLFGILLVIMTVYAVLFAVLFGVLQTSWRLPTVVVTVALFVIAVGLGQKLLFEGIRPFKASMLIGAAFFMALFLFYHIVVPLCYVIGGKRLYDPMQFPFAPFDPMEAVIGGAVYGLVFGLPIRGVLWVTGELRSLWKKSRCRK